MKNTLEILVRAWPLRSLGTREHFSNFFHYLMAVIVLASLKLVITVVASSKTFGLPVSRYANYLGFLQSPH